MDVFVRGSRNWTARHWLLIFSRTLHRTHPEFVRNPSDACLIIEDTTCVSFSLSYGVSRGARRNASRERPLSKYGLVQVPTTHSAIINQGACESCVENQHFRMIPIIAYRYGRYENNIAQE